MAVLIFSSAFLLACFSYFGYWIVLKMFARKSPTQAISGRRTVSIILAAKNEAANLEAKLENLRSLDYPTELVQIIVVSDGSTDETADILARHPDIDAVFVPESGGKALALNRGVACATGEFLFFVDVRQRIDPDALSQLVLSISDPSVGAVSGELILENADGTPSKDGLGLYWTIEKSIRRMESDSGSVVGATGAIYLMRRELFVPLPAGLILDDVLAPMHAARQGYRVLFQPGAVARDCLFEQPGKEFRRKVRTLTGNLQLLHLAPWLLSFRNPLLARFVSHKLLRLIMPFLLVIMLISSALSRSEGMKAILVAQLVFFGLSLMGALSPQTRRWRPISVSYTFVLLNVAATIAFYRFLMRDDVWN